MEIAITSFFNKISQTLKVKAPFVAYKHPNSSQIKGVIQKNKELFYTNDYSESGFVFAPFDDKKPSILFPLIKSEIISTVLSEDQNSGDEKNKALSTSNDARDFHIKLVQNGINFLRSTGNKKVVLSRNEIIDYSHFNVIETFKKLLNNYKNAMVYVWFHPKVGLWLGATPETLLSVENETFKTIALAGTQLFQDSLDVVWKNKEKQEQQFVTDYIVEKLHSIGLQRITISPAYTIKAGNLLHIRTDILGKLSPQLSLTSLLKALHPTPAVCGLPKTETKTFILNNEDYNREYYTGFLGELNINKTSNLFVNLRCMQVFKDRLTLYVGGGITVDSDPEKEWEETVAKSKVMLNILK